MPGQSETTGSETRDSGHVGAQPPLREDRCSRGQHRCSSCTCSSFFLLWVLLPFVPSSLNTKRFQITSLGSNCEPSSTSRNAGLFIQQIFIESLLRGDRLLWEGGDNTCHNATGLVAGATLPSLPSLKPHKHTLFAVSTPYPISQKRQCSE